ncbi:MAG: hypothetical protein JXR76_02255 [Deltaproteobacteria bacterium]|nr:hypothetical protein [Deltaproteobacteria bacterium]
MKHTPDETTLDKEQIAKAFVHAAFEKKLLADQIDGLYESLDNISASLDIESRQQLFKNTKEYMEKLAHRIKDVERQLNEMLPQVIAFNNETFFLHSTASDPRMDNTLSFATRKPKRSDEPFNDTSLEKPPESEEPPLVRVTLDMDAGGEKVPAGIQLPHYAPEKPTLLAMEPAPLVDENDEPYQFEEDDDVRLSQDEIFDTPPPVLTPSQNPDYVLDDAVKAFSEQVAGPENNIGQVAVDSSESADANHDAKIEDTHCASELSETSPVTARGPKDTFRYAELPSRIPAPDSSRQIAKIDLAPARDVIDGTEESVPKTDTLRLAQSTAGDTDLPDSDGHAPHDNLAGMLAPDETEAEPPTELHTDPSAEMASDDSDDATEAAPRDRTEESILFWKQSAISSPSTDDTPYKTILKDATAMFDRHFALSRIPSLLPGNAASSAPPEHPAADSDSPKTHQLDGSAKESAQNDVSPDAETSDSNDGASGNAYDDVNPLEKELFAMISAHMDSSETEARFSYPPQSLTDTDAVAIPPGDDLPPAENIEDTKQEETHSNRSNH